MPEMQTRPRIWWGWREELYSAKGRLLCQAGVHNSTCRGRRDHEPGSYVEHRSRFVEWPAPARWTVTLSFAWYDLWVGAYIDRPKRAVYLCPLPCLLVTVRRA